MHGVGARHVMVGIAALVGLLFGYETGVAAGAPWRMPSLPG